MAAAVTGHWQRVADVLADLDLDLGERLTGEKATPRAEQRSGERAGERAEQRSGERAEQRSGEQSGERAEQRSGARGSVAGGALALELGRLLDAVQQQPEPTPGRSAGCARCVS